MSNLLRTHVVSQFVCVTDRCPDTCCKHWSMQLDSETLVRYKIQAPELLDSVESQEDGSFIMRKDAQNGYCVRYDGGMCGIHKKYGEDFLGDACYFYPRVTRALGDKVIMGATMSCPEIARMALYNDNPFEWDSAVVSRVPQEMKNILPDGMTVEDVLAVHAAFMAAADDQQAQVTQVFARIASVSRSIQRIAPKDWVRVVPMYLRLADSGLPAPEPHPADAFNIVHALCGLVVASKKPVSTRLQETINDMQAALHVTLDWQNVLIHLSQDSADAYQQLLAHWEQAKDAYEPLLKRWLAMQLSTACFPFAGLGATLVERITIIGVRLATIKLALMCLYGTYGRSIPQDVVVRAVQSLSRFLEHLGDPAFSLQIYAETGWDKESRMRGLLQGHAPQ